MAVHYEFRADHDFGLTAVPKIWEWLEQLVESREHIDYEFT